MLIDGRPRETQTSRADERYVRSKRDCEEGDRYLRKECRRRDDVTRCILRVNQHSVSVAAKEIS
jgi:hypothetical protein